MTTGSGQLKEDFGQPQCNPAPLKAQCPIVVGSLAVRAAKLPLTDQRAGCFIRSSSIRPTVP